MAPIVQHLASSVQTTVRRCHKATAIPALVIVPADLVLKAMTVPFISAQAHPSAVIQMALAIPQLVLAFAQITPRLLASIGLAICVSTRITFVLEIHHARERDIAIHELVYACATIHLMWILPALRHVVPTTVGIMEIAILQPASVAAVQSITLQWTVNSFIYPAHLHAIMVTATHELVPVYALRLGRIMEQTNVLINFAPTIAIQTEFAIMEHAFAMEDGRVFRVELLIRAVLPTVMIQLAAVILLLGNVCAMERPMDLIANTKSVSVLILA